METQKDHGDPLPLHGGIFSDKPPGRGLAYDSGFEVFSVMFQVELTLFELSAIDISSPAKSSTATQNLPIAQAYLAGAPRIGRGLVFLQSEKWPRLVDFPDSSRDLPASAWYQCRIYPPHLHLKAGHGSFLDSRNFRKSSDGLQNFCIHQRTIEKHEAGFKVRLGYPVVMIGPYGHGNITLLVRRSTSRYHGVGSQ